MKRRKSDLTKEILFSLILAGGIFASGESARAVPGDYDADGTSDLAAVQINRTTQSTYWFVQPTPGRNPIGFSFPAAADALVTGRYYRGDAKVYPGIVRVKDASSPLEWTIKNSIGGHAAVNFGVPGDTIPNQGDLDCDGVTDVVVARNGRPGYFDGFKLWYVALSANPGKVQELLFGLASDRIGTADMDGDGCSELIVLRNDFTWYARRLFNDFVSAVQWGVPGDIALLPQDFNGDGNSDYVVARVFGNQLFGLLRLPNGTAEFFPLGSPTSVPLVGNFIGATGFAWIERATSFVGVGQFDRSAPAVFKFGELPTNHIVRPDGTVIDPLILPPTTPSVAPSNPNTGNSVSCDSSIRRNDGSGGFKNNPENSRGTIKIMFPKVPFTGNIRSVEAYTPGGNFIESLSSGSSLEWGDRERYYGHKSLRSYPKNLLIQVELNNGKTYCTTLEDPTRVYE